MFFPPWEPHLSHSKNNSPFLLCAQQCIALARQLRQQKPNGREKIRSHSWTVPQSSGEAPICSLEMLKGAKRPGEGGSSWCVPLNIFSWVHILVLVQTLPPCFIVDHHIQVMDAVSMATCSLLPSDIWTHPHSLSLLLTNCSACHICWAYGL